MLEEEIHLRDYFRVMIKWRVIIIAVFLCIVLGAAFYSFRKVPVYRATTRILIERTMPNIVSFEDPAALNNIYGDPQFLETQINIIKSRALVERVLQKPGIEDAIIQSSKQPQPANSLNETVKNIVARIPELLGAQETPLLSEQAQAAMQEEQKIDTFLKRLSVSQVRDSRLVEVSIHSSNPEAAASTVNTLVETYKEQMLETKTAASKNALRWLVEEVETARQKVVDSEAALQKYKEEHELVAVEGRQNLVSEKLADLSSAVNEAKITRMAVETQYKQLQRFHQGELETSPIISNDPVIQELKIQVLNLEREYLELLKKFREKHPNVVAVKTQIKGVRQQLDTEVQRIVKSVKNEYDMALANEQVLGDALEKQKLEALGLNQKAILYEVLEGEVESNQRIYDVLLERMKETSITERLETSNIQIVDRAAIPNSPIAPRKIRNILLAMIIGLLAGVTLAFFLEYWSDKIMTPDDLKHHLALPFLGMIPKISTGHLSQKSNAKSEELIATIVLRETHSTIAEAYRGLRTHVTFANLQDQMASSKLGSALLFTSPEPSEGKSSVVANLGITMAQSGRKTLIIDCDFRRPRQGKFFQVQEPWFGFADVLTDMKLDNGIVTIIQKTAIQNLHIIPCGTIPPNPSELLSLAKTKAILEKLEKHYDYILIDSPPVNAVADPLILSQIVKGVVMILHAGKTRRHIAQRARDELREAGATILGAVINGVDFDNSLYSYDYSYAYSYPKYYQQEDKKTNGKKTKSERKAKA